MLENMPVVELRGKDYDLQPLGIADLFKIKSLVESVIADVSEKLETESINIAALGSANEAVQMKVLMTAIDVAEDELYELLEMISGISQDKLKDKEVIPADAPVKILTTFWDEHPDIESFKGFLGKFKKNQSQTKPQE